MLRRAFKESGKATVQAAIFLVGAHLFFGDNNNGPVQENKNKPKPQTDLNQVDIEHQHKSTPKI